MQILTIAYLILITAAVHAGKSHTSVINSQVNLNTTVSDKGPLIDMLQFVVSDESTPLAVKIRTVESFEGLPFYSDYFDRLHLLFNELLQQSKKLSDSEGIFLCYKSLTDLYLSDWNKEMSLIYLDSTALYLNRVKNVYNIAAYYRMRGQYVQRYVPNRMPEAINYYNQALSIYDKTGSERHKDALMIILRNLTFEALMRQDSLSIFQYYNRIEDISKEHHSIIVDYSLMNVKIAIYRLHYQYSHNEAHLDSMVYYAEECLNINKSGLLAGYFNPYVIDLYVITADALRKKENPNLYLADSLLTVAENLYSWDSLGLACVYQTKANIYFGTNKLDSAELMALQAERYFKSGYRNSYYVFLQENIALLRDIYLKKEDYKKAIAYDNLWMEVDRDMKKNKIKEIELQYEFDKKEREFQHLLFDKQSQHYYIRLFLWFSFMLVILIIVSWLYVRSKQKNIKQEMLLSEMKKREAELKLQVKEKQSANIQLEKYELLSDFYLKELELSGKTQELEHISKEKERLDKQIDLYRQKIASFNDTILNVINKENMERDIIVGDIRELIIKHIPNNKPYLANLEKLNQLYIDTLFEKSKDTLSHYTLQYCICFAIGMEINEVIKCFNLEHYYVHIIRYRLKKKFGLGNKDDLNLFLKHLFYEIVIEA